MLKNCFNHGAYPYIQALHYITRGLLSSSYTKKIQQACHGNQVFFYKVFVFQYLKELEGLVINPNSTVLKNPKNLKNLWSQATCLGPTAHMLSLRESLASMSSACGKSPTSWAQHMRRAQYHRLSLKEKPCLHGLNLEEKASFIG